ncbi:MAG: hypothetical protein HWE27_11600 [Gammaproteobacteria bacterium]|nr:hypothetical protein [Gammaproteobacteria bacterium]
MGLLSKTISKLAPAQYLPSSGNPGQDDFSWSVSLNLGVWLKIETKNVQSLTLYIEYFDSRGKQLLLVDTQLQDGDTEILFSNLVKVPIKGSISDVSLLISYADPSFNFQIDELFIRVIEPPSDPTRLRKIS